jgi:hypothetical protein
MAIFIALLSRLVRRRSRPAPGLRPPVSPPLSIPAESIPQAPAEPVEELPIPPRPVEPGPGALPRKKPAKPGKPVRRIGTLSAEEAAAPPAIELPDLNFTVPPDLLVESFDPKYKFNWMNPTLMATAYPFRLEKLADFLAYFTEIDVVQEYRSRGIGDPLIQEKIRKSQDQIKRTREETIARLNQALQNRLQTDPYFAKITGANEKNLRTKRLYYLNREIQRLDDLLDNLQDRKANLLKRVGWYPQGDPRQEQWRAKAAELDPQIAQVDGQLKEMTTLRELFDLEAQLPKIDQAQQPTLEDMMRWEMRDQRERWSKMTQDQLLEEIIRTVNAQPERYPEWLVYMVIHFSGIRYKSAHGSWAEPCSLLQLLAREDIEGEINRLKPEQLNLACSQAAQEIQAEIKPGQSDPQTKFLGEMARKMQIAGVQKRALSEYRTSKAIATIQAYPNDKACLDRLVQYKAEKDAAGDPIPEWVWAEIVKYTPLRLETENPDWEAYSNDRWKFQDERWRQVMADWGQKDITGWRQKHKESLELVVTRAVCNEIAEHIQHLRGLSPYAGLTSKPIWYLRQQAKYPQKVFFKQAPDESDFVSGASILWLQWMDVKPNAWQVAHPLAGFSLVPSEQSKKAAGQRGEVSRKALEQQDGAGDGWSYQLAGDSYIRTRRKASKEELARQGKTKEQIQQIMAERAKSGDAETQYLRWRHEATVVGVFDFIDDRYVMTFETGNIGVILRRLSELQANPMIFVGYVPEVEQLPAEMDKKLVEMLRWDRILPGKNLPARIRPQKKPAVGAAPPSGPKPAPANQRSMLAIREPLRCWRILSRDQLDRPKFEALKPPLQLKRGARFSVSTTHKESAQDQGNGMIRAADGFYLRIAEHPTDARFNGMFVRVDDVANFGGGKWVKPHSSLAKVTLQQVKGRDNQGLPILEPLPTRLQLSAGMTCRISTTRSESNRDRGDGLITTAGQRQVYLVLECPALPAAEGLYLERDAVVDAS